MGEGALSVITVLATVITRLESSVGKGTPTIAWAPAVDSIVYGTAIDADQLNAR